MTEDGPLWASNLEPRPASARVLNGALVVVVVVASSVGIGLVANSIDSGGLKDYVSCAEEAATIRGLENEANRERAGYEDRDDLETRGLSSKDPGYDIELNGISGRASSYELVAVGTKCD